jgi:hypothetical protein
MSTPPPNVQAAAAIVNEWLDSQQGTLTPEQIARLGPAQKLDYTRRRSQETQMPAWRDPRAPR